MRRSNALPVREVIGEDDGEPGVWPYTMAPVRQLLTDGLELAPLTVLVGENGAGKSTVLEAIALAFGLGAEGGSTGSRNSTRPSESNLHEHLRLARGAGASRRGYFVRAETLHGLLTYLEQHPGPEDPAFHELSHGQAFHELLALRTARMPELGGLLVLDEPEAGLSFLSQLALVHELVDLVRDGAQALVATHSPVIAATPGAHLLQFDETGFREVSWAELEPVQLYRRFLERPSSFLGRDADESPCG